MNMNLVAFKPKYVPLFVLWLLSIIMSIMHEHKHKHSHNNVNLMNWIEWIETIWFYYYYLLLNYFGLWQIAHAVYRLKSMQQFFWLHFNFFFSLHSLLRVPFGSNHSIFYYNYFHRIVCFDYSRLWFIESHVKMISIFNEFDGHFVVSIWPSSRASDNTNSEQYMSA